MPSNFFKDLPNTTDAEVIQKRCEAAGGYVERIITRGQITPPGQWYEQETDEWILLLQGEARLLFEDTGDEVLLQPGDELWIEAGRRHRVSWTLPDQVTLWLAVHLNRA